MRRWLEVAGAAILVVVAVAAFLAWRKLHEGGRTTAVPPEEAVGRFRDGETDGTAPATAPPTTTAANALQPLPEAGVYVYSTTGSDSVDALGGATHTYPPTSTITVTSSGCGVIERWVAANERWDETTVCAAADGVTTAHFTGFHRFFGGDSTDDYVCDGDARPLDGPAGATWTTTCVASDETSVYHGTVLGQESLTVGGKAVDTLHVTTSIDDGDTADQQVIDTWYRLGSDLVVRRVADIATQSASPVGLVHYRERYQIDLQSLTPER